MQSSSLSSMTRMFSSSAGMVGTSRKDGDLEPVLLELLYCGNQPIEIDGLLNVRVRTDLVAALHVALVVGRGEDHDGDPPQLDILLDPLQRLATVQPGHVEVEQDDSGLHVHVGA